MQKNKSLLNILKAIAFASIGFLILYLLYRSQNAEYQVYCASEGIPAEDCSLLKKVINDFRSANYFWIFLIIACYIISNFSRAARWLQLIRPLGYQAQFWNSFFTIMLGYFANLGIPRIGEVIRAASMSRYEKIPAEKLIGTIVVGRTFDFIMLFFFIAIAFGLEYDTLWNYLNEKANFGGKLQSLLASWLIWGMLVIGAVGLILVYIFRVRLSQWRVYQKFLNILKGFGEGIRSVLQLERPWLFVLHSINIWVMYFLMTYLAFFAFEPTAHLSATAGLLTFIFGAFGIIVPAPGGMGAYQFFVQECLTIYGIDGNDAFSFANIVFFSLQIGANVLLGLVALVILPILNINK
ncbi:MAG: lysylphosphatidylglycerol synthase transmembrane domain-containing protein [Bacteroidota bacterium]